MQQRASGNSEQDIALLISYVVERRKGSQAQTAPTHGSNQGSGESQNPQPCLYVLSVDSLPPLDAQVLLAMLIGICGSICAGKHTSAEYLVQHHGFLRLHLPTPSQLHPSSKSPSNGHQSIVPDAKFSHLSSQDLDSLRLLPSVTDQVGTRGLSFPDVESLLDFVTKRWREHWVLTDICDEAILELLLRRPFFLLVNVDAPVGVRFERFSERYVIALLYLCCLSMLGASCFGMSSPTTPPITVHLRLPPQGLWWQESHNKG